jgi:uncharacterized peroxidase-related enzyme
MLAVPSSDPAPGGARLKKYYISGTCYAKWGRLAAAASSREFEPRFMPVAEGIIMMIWSVAQNRRNDMPYLEPLPRDAVAEFKERFEHYEKTRGFIPNSILTMQRRPAIAAAFMQLNQAVLYEGTVPEELKMLVSLVASQAAGCRYCQAHMANLSSIYQASDEKIAAVWEFQQSGLFSDAERAALQLAVNASMVPNQVSQQDFDELARHFDAGQIVELVATIALFGYLNRWNDTMATRLEDYPATVARRAIGSAGWEPGKHG